MSHYSAKYVLELLTNAVKDDENIALIEAIVNDGEKKQQFVDLWHKVTSLKESNISQLIAMAGLLQVFEQDFKVSKVILEIRVEKKEEIKRDFGLSPDLETSGSPLPSDDFDDEIPF